MALSLLRNSAKLRGLAALPRYSLQIQKTQNFTQFLNKNNTKTISLASRCKMQFINVTQQTKRNMSSDHGKLWTLEKLLSLALLGIVPAAFICPNFILDNLLAVAVVLHFHWGLEGAVIDYARPIILGPVLPKLAILLLYVVSISTLGALIYYNNTSIGIGETFRKFWTITGCPEDNEGQEAQAQGTEES